MPAKFVLTSAFDGFVVSVSAFPSGNDGKVVVSLTNHGNVDLRKLPVPAGAKPLFGGPTSVSFVSESPVKDTAGLAKESLTGQGRVPYGSAGDVAYYRRRAIRLSASVRATPAQQGKTVLTFSSEQLSLELPAPEDARDMRYTDSPTQLSFGTSRSMQQVHDYHKQALAADGCQATTQSPISIGFRYFFIFRNQAKDMLEGILTTVEGNTQVLLAYSTAAEVA